jgi:hypothetical protein
MKRYKIESELSKGEEQRKNFIEPVTFLLHCFHSNRLLATDA